MAKQKYYTTAHVMWVTPEFKEKYNVRSHERQYKIVCRASSRAEANRKANELGLFGTVFRPDFSSIVDADNDYAKECDKSEIGFVILTSGTNYGGQFVDIREALKKPNDEVQKR